MKVLVIRLSAMGDVAMCAPVLKALIEQHPNNEYYFITRKAFNPFFKNIEELSIINPDLNGKHKNITGLYKFHKELKATIDPDIIIDLHNVLRTRILKFFFRLSGKKSFSINKGRKVKKRLTQKTNKNLFQLIHSTERYAQTFLKAGIGLKLNSERTNLFPKEDSKNTLVNKNIGIAPFAKHIQKQYPLEYMKEVIKMLDMHNYKIFIFGGGEEEKQFAEDIERAFKNVKSMIGKTSMEEEINLISKLDLMLTMDSGNMHIAALTDVKIVSLWGATHPFAGFTPFTSDSNSIIIQNNELNCRPCSVYGNKVCYKKTLECMYSITPVQVFDACEKALKSSEN